MKHTAASARIASISRTSTAAGGRDRLHCDQERLNRLGEQQQRDIDWEDDERSPDQYRFRELSKRFRLVLLRKANASSLQLSVSKRNTPESEWTKTQTLWPTYYSRDGRSAAADRKSVV